MLNKLMSASDAVAGIADGATVAITGAGGGLLEPDTLLAALGARYREMQRPRDLTLLHAQGIGDGKARGLNHLAREGLVRRVIGAHWTWSPAMQALAADEKIEAYALPGGTIQHLAREIGAGRPGLFTRIGLGTYVDPRSGGGRMNTRACAPLSRIMEIDGAEFIHYPSFPIDVAIIRGTAADSRGNIAFDGEGAELDALVLAMAAHNSGGRVLVQVREIVADGQLRPRSVRVPAALVDAVVVEPGQRWSHAGDLADIAIEGQVLETTALERRLIASRAYAELEPELVASFGFGIPDTIAAIARREGLLRSLYTTLDHGHHGGDALQGALFGFVPNGEAMIDSPAQFDFYSGGGIDIAFLGFGEFDASGSVNVTRLGGRIIGPGGFMDIAEGARTIVFCGTLEAKGLELASDGETLAIVRPGRIAKAVAVVDQVSFSGSQAVRRGQRVLYVTERAVFRLTDEGLVLEEVAAGLDVDQDVIARMGFVPAIRAGGPLRRPPLSLL